MFSTYKHIGNPYSERRYTGRTLARGKRGFCTSPPKSGKLNDACFNKFTRVHEGLKYEDPHKRHIAAKKARMKKWLNPRGFRPSSPAKKSSYSSGDWNGAIGRPFEHICDGLYHTSLRPKTAPTKPRQILTSPAKVGYAASTPNICFSGLKYVASEYNLENEKAKKERRSHEAKVANRRPFTPSSTMSGKGTFDAQRHCSASRVYTAGAKQLSFAPNPYDGMTTKEIVESKADNRKPFVPSHPPKKGTGILGGTFSKFPESLPEPYADHQVKRNMLPTRLLPDKDRTKGVQTHLADRKAWRAVSNSKTIPIRSTRLKVYKATLGRPGRGANRGVRSAMGNMGAQLVRGAMK